MRSTEPALQRLRDRMAAVARHLARSDQRCWVGVLDGLSKRLDDEPGSTARAVLALFETRNAGGETSAEGDQALDDIVPTTNGSPMDRVAIPWEDVLDYPRQRHAMYEAAVALWLACGEHPALPLGEDGPVKLADYGWDCQIWARNGGFFARYDRGGHQTAWREDAISADEARWGLLGSRHFAFLVIAIGERLRAAGLDPYQGSATPLPSAEHAGPKPIG